MAYVKETQKSRKLNYSADSASTSRVYNCVDYTDSQAALAALTAVVPATITVGNYLCVLPEYEIMPVLDDPSRTIFKATVTWKTPEQSSGAGDEPKEPADDTSFTFSFSSIQDVKLYSGSQTTYTTAGSATGVEDGINRQHPDAMPGGVEINKPIVTFDAKTVISGATATNAWFKDRLDQVWTLNNATFRSLPARSVAFTGLSGSRRTDGNWDITYSFEYRPDNDGQTFNTKTDGTGETITTSSSGGWDYVWSAWDKLSTDAGKTERVIRAVHVADDIYPTSDFSLLGMVGV